MSLRTPTTRTRPLPSDSSRTRSPSRLGIGVGLFTLVSGILPQITDWHNENEVHRVVFVDIPGPLQVVFYTVIPVMIIWGGFMFANRMKNWERGAPSKRRTTTKNVGQRLKDFRAGRVHADAVPRFPGPDSCTR